MNTFELRKYKSNISKSKCLQSDVRFFICMYVSTFHVLMLGGTDNSVLGRESSRTHSRKNLESLKHLYTSMWSSWLLLTSERGPGKQ